MARRQFQLTPDQVRELERAYDRCDDDLTRARYQAVWLYGTNHPIKETMQITGCSQTSLMEWCRRYRAGGVAGLADRRSGGNRAKLTSTQITDLCSRLHSFTPADVLDHPVATVDGQSWTVADLRQAVQQWYDVVYSSRSSYHRLFDLCGFSYQPADRTFRPRTTAKEAVSPTDSFRTPKKHRIAPGVPPQYASCDPMN
jgi:transposase